jgi:hypothetical protein
MTTESLAQDIKRLEDRVRQLEDEREIRDLLSRYSFTADLYPGAAWVDLWTDNGVYDLGTGYEPDGAVRRYEGPAQLMDLITGAGMPPRGHSQHHTQGPLVIEVMGDRATAEGYSITYVNRETGNEVWNLGFSRWTFRRIDGSWRIEERQRREIGNADQASVITAPTNRGH